MPEWGEVVSRISNFIRETVRKAEAEGVVVGVSGGIDSACVTKLCTLALGKENVLGLIMPEEGVTPAEDVKDALTLCKELEIDSKVIEISPAVSSVCGILECGGNKISVANIKPRIRMICLYYYANTMNRLVAGTGNRSELLVGYFTKYGDGGVDFLPIGDMYKTEVIELAEYLEIPERIRNKKPSARLWSDQTDEGELGISYRKLDSILKAMDKLNLLKIENELNELEDISNRYIEKIAEISKTDTKEVELVVKMVKKSAHKRQQPPILKLRSLLDCTER